MDTSGDDSKSDGTDAAPIKITDNEGTHLDKPPMNERRRFLITVRMILRFDCRDLFGVEFSNRCGHWLDRYMSNQVSKYGYWVAYPRGNHVLEKHSNAVWAAVVSTDGRYLFTAGNSGSIIVWDLLDNSMLKQFDTSDSVICLDYESDLLVSGGGDSKIRIFDGITHDLIRTMEGDSEGVFSVKFNKECTQIVSTSSDFSVNIWCVKTGECLATLTGHTRLVSSAYFMDNDTRVMSGSRDGSIKLWSISDKSECDTITDGIEGQIYTLCMNCDASLIACCFFFSGFTVYTWPKMDIVRSVELHALKCEFHPSNPDVLAVAGSVTQSLNVYNIRSGETITEWKGHPGRINGLCWSRDGYRLVSVSQDTNVRVWDYTPWLE